MRKLTLMEDNYVFDRNFTQMQIDFFDIDKACQRMFFQGLETHPHTEYLDKVYPIALDDKKIELLGFEWSHYIGRINFYRIGNFFIEDSHRFPVYYKTENPICFVDYVHELQNLFLALTKSKLYFPMAREKAIQLMKEGQKVKHRLFDDHEWITMEGSKIITEDGCSFEQGLFWADRSSEVFLKDWQIWRPKE